MTYKLKMTPKRNITPKMKTNDVIFDLMYDLIYDMIDAVIYEIYMMGYML